MKFINKALGLALALVGSASVLAKLDDKGAVGHDSELASILRKLQTDGIGPDCPESHGAYLSGTVDFSEEQAVGASCEAGTFKDCYLGGEARQSEICADGVDPADLGLNIAVIQLQCAFYKLVFECCDGEGTSYETCKEKIPYDGISMFGIKEGIAETLPAFVASSVAPETLPEVIETGSTAAAVTLPEVVETGPTVAAETLPEVVENGSTVAAETSPEVVETGSTVAAMTLPGDVKDVPTDDGMSLSMSMSLSMDYGSGDERDSASPAKVISIYSFLVFIIASVLNEL